jgi:hypothetical protein
MRVALLNAEADTQREVAAERARSVQTKSSFLVVIAGLLAGASFDAPLGSDSWWLAAVPLALALATVVTAVVALWPAPAGAINPAAIRSMWIDNTQGSYELEIYLLKVKTVAYTETQDRTDRRVTALKIGFVLLSAALAAALVVYIIQRLN